MIDKENTKQTKPLVFFVCFVIFVCSVFSLRSFGSGPHRYGEPVQLGMITNPKLAEISGITPSHTAKGLWWVHNDSGDQARIYIINSSGKLLGQYTVAEARNRDWEDMAGYKDSRGTPMLYLADSGDNELKRDDLTIYRVKEPDLSKGVMTGMTATAEAFPFRYPDGRQNAEALFVDPKNGRPYLVTKTMSPPCGVYRFPLPLRPGVKATLEKVEGAGADRISKMMLVTGAANSPDGRRVIVRSYFGAFELSRDGGGTFESIFKSVPESIKLAPERQGEAISYTTDGRSVVTTSEKIPAPIFKVTRENIN